MKPKQPGFGQKTDKIDSKKLAIYLAYELLTFIHIPDKSDESVRDLLRSKLFLVEQQTMVKNHISSICRRLGMNYCQETSKKSRWTHHHLCWLAARINKLEEAATKVNFQILLKQFEDVTKNIDLYETEIEHIGTKSRYEKKVKVLSAFKGVKTRAALTLITELGDIRRFDHPRKITSYVGFDIREYSSGGKAKRYGISKLGNPNIREAAVDAVKFTTGSPAA